MKKMGKENAGVTGVVGHGMDKVTTAAFSCQALQLLHLDVAPPRAAMSRSSTLPAGGNPAQTPPATKTIRQNPYSVNTVWGTSTLSPN